MPTPSHAGTQAAQEQDALTFDAVLGEDRDAPCVGHERTQYQLPENTYKDWARNETRDFKPDARQKLVIDAVRRAIEEKKLFFTSDVYAFCVEQLAPSADTLAKHASRVEGGEVGMDLYYARQYLDAQKRFALEEQAAAQLRPRTGMNVGTLVLQDLKRCTGATITAVEGDALTLEAKRGTSTVRFTTTALGLRHGIDRAHKRKLRKTGFSEFCGIGR